MAFLLDKGRPVSILAYLMQSAYSNLKISVQTLREKKLFRFEEPARAFPMLAEMAENRTCDFLSPVSISLNIYRVNDMFRGEGIVETTIGFQCSRCLENFELPVSSEFALNFTSEAESEPENGFHKEHEINAEQAGLVLFTNDEIDLTEAIQDQILMALPIRPLCGEDCQGLCPHCGINLNQSSCSCDGAVFNPKFQSLADLDIKKKTD